MKADCKPVVFWHSDPVRPDETLILAGEDFAENAKIELAEKKDQWISLEPLQKSRQCLKAVVPANFHYGRWFCRVKQGREISKEREINAPDIWWKQGDAGVDAAFSGSWLRLFGKCLNLNGKSKIRIGGKEIECVENDCFALKVLLPDDLQQGEYSIEVYNGNSWGSGGKCEVFRAKKSEKIILHLSDHPEADPSGMRDSTVALVQMLEFARCIPGGAIIEIPRGRFRIDSGLRPMTYMKSQLFVTENVTLRGAGANLTSLWWPDQKDPLPCLVECANNSSIENLAIYAQGPLHEIIKTDSHVRLENLLIRANPFYMVNMNPKAIHHERPIPPENQQGGAGITIWGTNCRISNCDILSPVGITVFNGAGSVICNNKICAINQHSICGSEIIYENNSFVGGIQSGGSNIAMFGPTINRHVYYKGNSSKHLYTGDHECLTFDGHGTAYFGKVTPVNHCEFELNGKNDFSTEKGHLLYMDHTAVYIVDGRGMGQIRFLTGFSNGKVTVNQPWDVEPDAESLVAIGVYNGNHIIADNTAEDGGALVQLYPTNNQCIVVRNKGTRTNNINSLGNSGSWIFKDPAKYSELSRFEISWYNQFFDNEILAGNAWGGGCTEIDRWLGGESTLLIYSDCRQRVVCENGEVFRRPQTPEWVQNALKEKKPRDHALSPSRFQVVRRHRIHNNSSIRVQGPVHDVVIENCQIANSDRGIRVDTAIDMFAPNHCGQTFQWDPEPSAETPAMLFQEPVGILIRKNRFENVLKPYAGNAIQSTDISDH